MTVSFSKDLLERVISTFVQAFAAALVTAWAGSGLDVNHLGDLSAWQKLATGAVLAGCAAVFSLVKGLLAKNVGDAGTASLVAAPAAGQHSAADPVNITTDSVTPPA